MAELAVLDEAALRRPIAGRLRYPTPPDPGTIVGPAWTGELLTVIGQDSQGRTVLGYATVDELAALPAPAGPRSLTERGGVVRRRR